MDLLENVRTLMRRYESLEIGGIRDAQLQRRIDSFTRKQGIESEALLLASLRKDADLREKLMDALTINVTSVYRNADSWDILRNIYLPKMGPRVRMWSAGASTGAEAYTMAVSAAEAGKVADIVATDIDIRSLEKAKIGHYPHQELNEAPAALRDKYFTKDETGWAVDPELKKRIRFKKHDLLAEPVVGTRFDLIACRNVVIYFSREAQRDLHRRLAEALRPGGILFIGGAERIADPGSLGLSAQERPFYMRNATVKAVAV